MVCIWSKGLNLDLTDPMRDQHLPPKLQLHLPIPIRKACSWNTKQETTSQWLSTEAACKGLNFLVYAIMQRPVVLWDRPVHIRDFSRLFYEYQYNPQQQHLLSWCDCDLATVWFVGWTSNANRRTGAQLEQLLKFSFFLLKKEKDQWAVMCEREKKKLNTKTGKERSKESRKLTGRSSQLKSLHFSPNKADIQSPYFVRHLAKVKVRHTKHQHKTDRRNERKTSVSQQSSTVGSEFTVEGKVSRQPLFSDDCWAWRDISKGQLKKQRRLEQQQTLPSWEGYWTKHVRPCAPMDTKKQKKLREEKRPVTLSGFMTSFQTHLVQKTMQCKQISAKSNLPFPDLPLTDTDNRMLCAGCRGTIGIWHGFGIPVPQLTHLACFPPVHSARKLSILLPPYFPPSHRWRARGNIHRLPLHPAVPPCPHLSHLGWNQHKQPNAGTSHRQPVLRTNITQS